MTINMKYRTIVHFLYLKYYSQLSQTHCDYCELGFRKYLKTLVFWDNWIAINAICDLFDCIYQANSKKQIYFNNYFFFRKW